MTLARPAGEPPGVTRAWFLDHGLHVRSGVARSQMKMSAIWTVAKYRWPVLS